MPEFVDLEPEGRLNPRTETGARFLAERAGPWRIVPASDDLLLLRRPTLGATGDRVRAIMAADLEGFALGEMLAFMAQSSWTGVITVSEGEAEKSLFIQQGSVRWCASNVPADRLGQVLQRLGLAEANSIEPALLEAQEAGRRIGEVLVERGVVSTSELYQALKHQMEEIVHSTLLMKAGLFFLFNDPVETRFSAQINLDLGRLLMDGLRRIDELDYFRARIPSGDCFVKRRGQTPTELNEEETGVWEAIDGKRTVNQVAAAAHMSEFDATKILFRLVETGSAEVSEERRETVLGTTSGTLTSEHREITRVFNTIFREIFNEIAQIGPTAGFAYECDAFLQSDQHNYQALFQGVTLDEEGMLPEQQLLEHALAHGGGTPQSVAKWLYDGLNELMFFELFQAGEVLTPDRDDDLSRRVKVIYEMLEV